MTENKRFKLIGDENLEHLMQYQLELPIYDYQNNKKRLSLGNTLDLLNYFNDESEHLNKNNLHLHHELRLKNDKIIELEKENERLKKQLSHLEYRFTEYRIKLGDVE